MRKPKLPPLPTLPPILADEVNDALSRARKVMTPDEAIARLETYRRSIPAQLGILGVFPLDHPFRAGEAIADLAMAFQKLHFYRRENGAKDYLSTEVGRLAISHDQSCIASKPRKRTDPVRKAVTKQMKSFRVQDRTLPEFIDAAMNGSIDGLVIQDANRKGVKRYTIDVEDVDHPDRNVAKSTLENWWLASARSRHLTG